MSAILEYAPILVFFVTYLLSDLFVATQVLMIVAILSLSIQYFNLGIVSWINILTVCFVLLFGALTLLLQDEQFIKMKLTILEIILASVLLIGLWFKKLFIKKILGKAWPNVPDSVWRIFTIRCVIFFLIIAAANEIIWRTQSTDIWILFKTFGVLVATFVFTISQIPLVQKFIVSTKEDTNHESHSDKPEQDEEKKRD